MTNCKLLNDEISNSGITIIALANKIGISREGLYKKLSGETEFKASEISAVKKILHLSNRKRDAIFFAEEVELHSTKDGQ